MIKIPGSESWPGSAQKSNDLLLARHPAGKNFRRLLELSAKFRWLSTIPPK